MSKQKLQDPLAELFNISEDGDDPLIESSEEIESPEFDSDYEVIPGDSLKPNIPSEVQEKDEEDKQIDKQIDEVYTAAINTFNNQMAYAEIVDPKYAARNAEVAASYLNLALQAANSKAKIKTDRKRNGQFIPYKNGQGTNATNVVVASREEILKMLDVEIDKKG